MLPILVHPQKMRILVQGDGPATTRRCEYLQDAGCAFDHVQDAAVNGAKYDIVFVADFDDATSENLYSGYREAGSLVNVEDKKPFCDFHVPAVVRRGDLLLTVSTGAKSPRLARRVRMMLENLFPAHWGEKLDAIGAEREQWKKDGASFAELAEKSDVWLDENGMVQRDCECLRVANQKEAA